AFFEERRGRFHSFLWRDGLDHAATDETIGMGDGTTVSFQLTKQYGATFDPYSRVITKPVAASVVVKVDGVVAAVEVDELTGMVSFAAAPAEGAAITASFEFDVPVRFDTDRLDVELTSFEAAEVPVIPLVEVLE